MEKLPPVSTLTMAVCSFLDEIGTQASKSTVALVNEASTKAFRESQTVSGRRKGLFGCDGPYGWQ